VTGWIWAATLALAAIPASEPEPDPFAACAARADEVSDRQRHRCVYMAARSTGDFERAERILSEAEVHRPWAVLSLANVRAAVGDDRAEATYRQALQLLEGKPEGQVNALLGLRVLYSRRGRMDAASEALGQARQVAGDAPALRARVDAEDARLHWLRGEPEEAVRLASGVDLDGAEHQLKVVVHHVLAGALLEVGRVDASWSHSQQLVELASGAGDHYVEATARLNALAMLEDHPELATLDREAFATEALAVAREGGNPYIVAGAQCYLGSARADVELLQACLDEARALDEPNLILMALRRLAALTDDPTVALQRLDEAEHAGRRVALRFAIAQVQHQRAATLWEVDRDASERAAHEAVTTVEAIRDTRGAELARAGFASIWRLAWLSPASRWRQVGAHERAWDWVEQMRARELRTQRLGVAVDEAQRQRVSELQDQLWAELPGAERAAILEELAEAEAAARVQLHSTSLAEVQGRLAPDQAMLVYVLVDDPGTDSWLWVVDRQGIVDVPIPEPEEVGPAIDLLLGLQAVPEPAVQRLREQLLAPALAHTDAHRLLVVPDGPLHRLPFGLLTQEHAVTTVPSATVWADVAGHGPARSVVSVADPAGVGLPYARDEGQRWVDHLGGQLLVGPAATRAAVEEALPRHGVLHLATHAEVDGAQADHQLALADGGLRAVEVAELPLDDRVVVLAACRGGDGPVYTSEGAMSLARTFLQGGARTIVTSVVPLRDDQASALFGAVAEAWADGGSLAEAVRSVQARYAVEAPGALGWAGLVVVGDGDVVVDADPRRLRWPWAIAVALGLLGLGWGARRATESPSATDRGEG